MDCKVSKKRDDDKWWSYGNIKKNKWGNLTLGFKVTPELKAIFNNTPEGEWVNFSLFENKIKEDASDYARASGHDAAKANGYQPEDIDDSLPF